jgi:hypothetical protein
MKTLREVLLRQHQDAESKLDTIREQVVANLANESRREAPRQRDFRGARGFIAEFLLPLRWHLAGMSALWVMIAVLNSEPAPVSPAMVAKEQTPEPPQLLAAVRENRRQVLELIDGASVESTARPFVPRPRSAFKLEVAVV